MYDLQIEFPAPPVPREPRRSRSPSAPNPHGVVGGDAHAEATSTPSPSSCAAPSVESVGVCLINSLRQPGQRAGRRRAPAPRARRAGVHLGGDLAADPRVPADDHHRVQRGDDAGDRAVPRRAAEVARRRGLRRLGADDAVQRRRRVGRRRRPARRSASSSPARRPVRWPAAGSPRRLGEERLLCFDMGGTTAKSCLIVDGEPRADQHVRGRPHLPVQEGLRVPGVGAVGRPRRDRRRRRQPGPRRRARPAEGRPRVRRRRSRPGVLRPRRHRAGGHRRRPRARPARRRRTSSAATCRSTSTRATAALRVGGRRSSACRSATPRPASTSSSTRTWPPSSRMHAVEQGADLRGVTRARVRRRRAGARLRRRRAARVAAGRVPGQRQRAVGVRHARHAGAHRPRPQHGAAAGSRRRRPSATRCSTSCAPRAAACSAAAGVRRRRRSASATALDARYLGQGNEITVWVGEGDRRGRPPTTRSSTCSRPTTAGSTA